MRSPEALAEKVRALSPPDRLILAAALLHERQADTALSVIRLVERELHMAIILRCTREITDFIEGHLDEQEKQRAT